jgi:diguanylate cyclase (GGDEF)-like protein/PAS domain S-box-containing protein
MDTPPISILFIEDSKLDVDLALRTLAHDGLHPSWKHVATERALREALSAALPDVILSDFSMPGFDGLQALQISHELAPDVPFIFLSGTIGEERAIEAIRLGAKDYVLKDRMRRLGTAVRRSLAEAADRARTRVAQDELRKSESLKGAILEASLDCLITIDKQGHIVEFNPAAAATFGISREQALGKSMVELIVPPRFREAHRRGFAQYFATGKGSILGKRLELAAIRADGTEFPVELAITPIRSNSESLFTGCLRDITARNEAQSKIKRLSRVYAVLSGINAAIVRTHNREELYREVCRIAVEAGEFRTAWVGIVDRQAMGISPVAWHGAGLEYIRRMPLSLDENAPEPRGVAGRAWRERKAMVSNDMATDPRILLGKEALHLGVRSLAMLPLIVSEEVVGVLALYAAETGFFDDDEMKLLLELAGDVSFALEHIEKEAKLNYLALYDSLTGLGNRTLFRDRLRQYLRVAGQSGEKLALVAIDIDRLQAVNDSLGRQAGDALLKQLAARLVQGGQPEELARIGADNFAVVLRTVKGRSEVTRRLEKLWRGWLGTPYRVDTSDLKVTARAGIALFPNDTTDAEALLRNAEAALRKAKQVGERQVFYTPALTERTAERLTLENRLRQALEKDEFVLHYQPKVDFERRRIAGVEALIRWQDPELGLVPPGKFIPLMEETGLILEVGAWALRRAAMDHLSWMEQGLQAPRVAVNVSAIQMRQRDFVATIQAALTQGAAPPGIDLEITESLIMEDIQGNIEKLKAIQALGLSIAIDDFGTGYSSLGYLAKLPLQALKIDRSFISTMLNDPNSMTLVSTIISLAHSLRLKVVAEGVETEDQAKMLGLLRCDELQGYLFSRPVPVVNLVTLLQQAT